jgi:hypothetical protein
MKNAVFLDVTRRNIPEDGILHSHRRENLKSYYEQCLDIRIPEKCLVSLGKENEPRSF